MEKYTKRYSITASDMNKVYRLGPHAVLLYFQDAFARFMACKNYGTFDLAKQGRMWIISELEMNMTSADTFWTEDIDVAIWISEKSSLRVYSDFIVSKTDGTLVAKGYGCWSLLDMQTHRLEKTDCLSNLIIVPEFTMFSHRKMRFNEPIHSLRPIVHKVNPVDLDFNGHVNNRTYFHIAMQTASVDFMASHYVEHLVIHWSRETFLGEMITCNTGIISHNEFIHSLNKEDGMTAALIYSKWKPVSHQRDIADCAIRA